MDRLQRELGNLRAVLKDAERWRDAESIFKLVAPSWRFWFVRGAYNEARNWLTKGFRFERAVTPALDAQALHAAGLFAWRQTDFSSSMRYLEQSLALRRTLGDDAAVAETLNELSIAYGASGSMERSKPLLDESRRIWEQIGDKAGIARTLDYLSWVCWDEGDFAAARALVEQSLALFREMGDTWIIAGLLSNLGEHARLANETLQAEQYFNQSLHLQQELKSPLGVALAQHNLGHIAIKQGRPDEALSLLRESLLTYHDLGTSEGIPDCYFGLAHLAAVTGYAERGARLLGFADAQCRARVRRKLSAAEQLSRDLADQAIRGLLDKETYEHARRDGAALTMDLALAEAMWDGEPTIS
jgi:tetratricopeptide (TPR) repeat protein